MERNEDRSKTSSNESMMEREETRDLISSEKVDGTAVYNRKGEKLGTIHHFMVGKRDGKVRFAVMNSGGLFGMGGDYFPMPWNALDYDTEKGGYLVDIDKDKLEKSKAPSFSKSQDPDWSGGFGKDVNSYYMNR